MRILILTMAFVLVIAIVCVIAFVITRKLQGKIVSDASPFSFADDVLIVNAGTIFSVQSARVECVKLQYNPNAMQNKFYEMRIHIVKTDGSRKSIRYTGSRSGAQPQDMAATLKAHRIRCIVNDSSAIN